MVQYQSQKFGIAKKLLKADPQIFTINISDLKYAKRSVYRDRSKFIKHLGGAQSCLVQSSSVPTYVLFLQVTLTTSMPADRPRVNLHIYLY